MNSQVQRLPEELIRCILRFTSFVPSTGKVSKKDMDSCSLVCHAWRDISQSFLFTDIVCTFSDGTSPTGKLAQFRDFFQASPVICACVRKLTLEAVPNVPPGHQNVQERVDVELCCSILLLLPRLDTIVFVDFFLAQPPATSLSHEIRYMATVEVQYQTNYFSVGHITPSLEDLIPLVTLFDEIGMLRVGCYFLCPFPIGSPAYSSGTKVSAVFTDAVDGISGLVQATRYENTLRSLHVATAMMFDAHASAEWAVLHALMASGVGEELIHIGFSVEWSNSRVDIDEHGALLRLCPRLESFALHFGISTVTPRSATSMTLMKNRKIWSDISHLVPSLPLTVLCVIFGLEVITRPACPYLRGVEEGTAQLEAAMTRRFGKSLPVVIFKSTYGQPFDEEEQERLKALFPMLTQEGAIRFDENV